jgi:hypothetical protein
MPTVIRSGDGYRMVLHAALEMLSLRSHTSKRASTCPSTTSTAPPPASHYHFTPHTATSHPTRRHSASSTASTPTARHLATSRSPPRRRVLGVRCADSPPEVRTIHLTPPDARGALQPSRELSCSQHPRPERLGAYGVTASFPRSTHSISPSAHLLSVVPWEL